MNATIERDTEMTVEDTNVYIVKVNGKIQGRVTYFWSDDKSKGYHGIFGSKDFFDTQEAAAREVIRRNGRQLPKDVSIRKK